MKAAKVLYFSRLRAAGFIHFERLIWRYVLLLMTQAVRRRGQESRRQRSIIFDFDYRENTQIDREFILNSRIRVKRF